MEYLTNLYNEISGNPLIMVGLIAALIVIGYAIVKKLFKVAIVMVACIAIYLGYIAFTEGSDAARDVIDKSLPDSAKELMDEFGNQIDEFGNQIDGLINDKIDSSQDSK